MIRSQVSYYKINSILKLSRAGESAVLLEFINQERFTLVDKNRILQQWVNGISEVLQDTIIDTVVSYESALVIYQADLLDFYFVLNTAKTVLVSETHSSNPIKQNNQFRTHVIPVCYELNKRTMPNDSDYVCEQTKIDRNTLIELHTSIDYQVFAVGFMPNFAYLGELPKQLALKRLANPRVKVPAGAVAIAETQTAIYPSISPGGWHIIGYIPLDLSINNENDSKAFKTGDKVRFESINYQTYEDMRTSSQC
ncbi:5-oxoprolinase subunit B family protein [Glaciecola petra]|uniref:Carboxyltransferase domain-containing protein n=1 Tax=Glaciecola petra TaxID=3075602 RepID=A0ABU2ZP38_9ALTE|nr:carboxyltransferase domain-containing protein [Aestuariibacter sp. P117]MDT0594391.1 carboxyltransferase domain-containing protein [Aestuariibacter sp. P117]